MAVSRLILARIAILVCGLTLAVPSAAKPIVVLAAASLQESLTAAAQAWAERGHERPVLSFAASSALARQIEAGAPADLFISADQEWMDELAKARLIRSATRVSFLSNRLALIAASSSRVQLPIRPDFRIDRALGNGRLAMADPNTVPAGRYGKAALTALGVWSAVSGRIAPAENVRAALILVERGEVPLGIVYATDALASRKVRVVGLFPASTHPPIRYPLALLATSRDPQALAFRQYLLSADAARIFRRFGFGTKQDR